MTISSTVGFILDSKNIFKLKSLCERSKLKVYKVSILQDSWNPIDELGLESHFQKTKQI